MVSRAQLAEAFPGFPNGKGEVDLAELIKDPNARVMRRDGLIVSVRILLAGANARKSGENLARFRGTPEATLAQDAVTGWMNSPGHRANLLDGGFTHIGIGVARGPNGEVYITQNFCAY
jgi:hypothetical protein